MESADPVAGPAVRIVKQFLLPSSMRFNFRRFPFFVAVSLIGLLPRGLWACTVQLNARHLFIDHKTFDQASKEALAEKLTACGDGIQLSVNAKATIGNFLDVIEALKASGKRFDLHVKKNTFKDVLPRDIRDSIDAGAGDPVADLSFSIIGAAGHEHLFISSGP